MLNHCVVNMHKIMNYEIMIMEYLISNNCVTTYLNMSMYMYINIVFIIPVYAIGGYNTTSHIYQIGRRCRLLEQYRRCLARLGEQ